MSKYSRQADKVVNKVVVEGTEHTGPNRAAMRAQGARSKDRPDPKSAPEHWLRRRLRELAEQEDEINVLG